jgi:predicted ATPase
MAGAMSLARLEQFERKKGEAHGLLAKVYGWFTEGHDTLDLQHARTLMR